MVYFSIIVTVIMFILLARLIQVYMQLKAWADELDGSETGSNLRLTSNLKNPIALRLCKAFNRRLEQEQRDNINQQKAGKELKYTISCISHDIRTPLTGAAGYVQLLKTTTDNEKRIKYTDIILRRLKDLEVLLDELFLYTKLIQQEYDIDCGKMAVYPILCSVLAEYYDKIQANGADVELSFPDEALTVYGNNEATTRVFTNLIKNALIHGNGCICITQSDKAITFSNHVKDCENIDVNRLFERFYKADNSRHAQSSGLGLSIVQQLMAKMGGNVSASLDKEEKMLSIEVEFLG